MPLPYFLNKTIARPGSEFQANPTQQPGFMPGTTSQRDPSLALRALQQQRMGELEDRQAAALQTGDAGSSAAVKALMGSLQGDIQEFPLTAQKAQVDAYEQAQQNALTRGFSSPQEADAWERKMAELKVGMPAEVARISGQQEIQKQQEANKGPIGLEQERQKGYGALQDMLGAGGPGIKSISRPGGGSISFQTPHQTDVSNPVYTQLATARANLAKKQGGIFSNPAAEQAKVNSLVAAAINQHSADESVKDVVRQIMANPKAANWSFDQILGQSKAEDGTSLTPQEIDQLHELLSIVRGQAF